MRPPENSGARASQAAYDAKIERLIEILRDRTERGELAWRDVEDRDAFVLMLPPCTVVIECDAGAFAVRIIDEHGRLVEDVREPGDALGRIFAGARRWARGADEAVEAVLKCLE